MADHSIPHFHNDPGVPTIKVRVKEFMCTGAKPPFDHPHIFIDMGSDTEAICSYCSTRYVYDDGDRWRLPAARVRVARRGVAHVPTCDHRRRRHRRPCNGMRSVAKRLSRHDL